MTQPLPPPPPPKRRDVKVVEVEPVIRTTETPTDMAHVRRVTLNLVRYAACCPADLRPALERLAASDWRVDALSREDDERIFAYVDADLAGRALAEYVADTESIIDHRAADATCRLCGQQHIRFEFTLRNTAGGRDHRTGSSCIIEYGLNVDGALTAEEARARLNGAITRAMRRAERDAWQEAHPDHAAEMHRLSLAFKTCLALPDRALYRHLRPDWKRRAAELVKGLKPVVKFYTKEGFLTDLRTEQVYVAFEQGARGVLTRGPCLLALADAALAETSHAVVEVTRLRDYWQAFRRDHAAIMTDSEGWVIRECEVSAYPEDGSWRSRTITDIRARAARVTTSTPPVAAPAVLDDTDLPI